MLPGMDTSNAAPQLVVSVVSHGQGSLLPPLLEQLARASRELPIRVVITQNLPEPRCAIDAPPTLDLIWIANESPKGFGENHNAAFCQDGTMAPFFCVLNPDVRLRPDSLRLLVQTAARMSGIVGPRVVAPNGQIEDSARRLPTLSRLLRRWIFRRFEPDYSPSVPEQQVDWLAGMCMVFDRETFGALNGFDERYHLYCEDVDICLRAHLVGGSVTWVQAGEIVHDAQRASHRRWRYLVWHLQSLLRLATSRTYWRFHFCGQHRI